MYQPEIIKFNVGCQKAVYLKETKNAQLRQNSWSRSYTEPVSLVMQSGHSG